MANNTTLISAGINATCACTNSYGRIIEASRDHFAIALAIFGIFSNLLTAITLLRMRMKTSTDTLLFAITIVDFAIPVLHLTHHFYVVTEPAATGITLFRLVLFYLWHVFAGISLLLTVVLAGRKVIAIEYAHKLHSVNDPQRTNKVLAVVCVFSAIVLLPILTYKPFPNVRRNCIPDPRREILYVSLTMNALIPNENYPLKFSYWVHVLGFDLLGPLILALLSIRFAVALWIRVNSSSSTELMEKMARTKLILIVSLFIQIRDSPIALISISFFFSKPSHPCLTTFRLFAKELTMLMSSLNLFVLYYTNKRFQEAVPWCRGESQEMEESKETKTTSLATFQPLPQTDA